MASALIDKVVSTVEKTQNKIIKMVTRIPAWAVIHGRRRNRITPKMFWRQGKNTPFRVFCLSSVEEEERVDSTLYALVGVCPWCLSEFKKGLETAPEGGDGKKRERGI